MVILGIDAHKRTHTVVAIDEAGRELGDEDDDGDHDRCSPRAACAGPSGSAPSGEWAVEDCRHLSRRLEADLLAAGERIVRVPPKLMAHARDSARTYGKSDPIDALAVARAALREPDLPDRPARRPGPGAPPARRPPRRPGQGPHRAHQPAPLAPPRARPELGSAGPVADPLQAPRRRRRPPRRPRRHGRPHRRRSRRAHPGAHRRANEPSSARSPQRVSAMAPGPARPRRCRRAHRRQDRRRGRRRPPLQAPRTPSPATTAPPRCRCGPATGTGTGSSRTGNRQLNAAIHRIAITQTRCHPDAKRLPRAPSSAGNTKTEAVASQQRCKSWRTLVPCW